MEYLVKRRPKQTAVTALNPLIISKIISKANFLVIIEKRNQLIWNVELELIPMMHGPLKYSRMEYHVTNKENFIIVNCMSHVTQVPNNEINRTGIYITVWDLQNSVYRKTSCFELWKYLFYKDRWVFVIWIYIVVPLTKI